MCMARTIMVKAAAAVMATVKASAVAATVIATVRASAVVVMSTTMIMPMANAAVVRVKAKATAVAVATEWLMREKSGHMTAFFIASSRRT